MLYERRYEKMSIKCFKNALKCGIILILVIALAGLALTGCAKPKVYHIGILSGLEFLSPITDGLKEKMTELGYIEGKNIVYDFQKTGFDLAAYQTILKKFVADKVDAIVAYPTEATMEAKKATEGTKIPVIFNFCFTDGLGIIKTIAEPGGNITGVRFPGPDIALKRFEVMQEIAPKAKRYWIPYQKGYPIVPPQIDAIKPAAASAGITLIEAPANDPKELDTLIKDREKSKDIGIDAILIVAEPLSLNSEVYTALLQFADKHKIPFGGALVAAGDLSSIYGVSIDFVASGKLGAPILDKVLKGTPAGTIPVVSEENFLEINPTAAQKLGITVPDDIIKQAGRVVK
jgi:putative ABC transport system substrate-binding protein